MIRAAFTYPGLAATATVTNAVTINVACPALVVTTGTPPTAAISKTLDNAANVETILAAGWITGVSTHTSCVTAFSLVTTVAGTTALTGNNLSINPTGELKVDRAQLLTSVTFWIKY